MNTAAAAHQPETKIWVASADQADAVHWAALLESAGLEVRAETDLRRVLSRMPEVVVIDPCGWESSCRRILEGLAGQPDPPPAILFLAPDPTVQFRAGPAYGYLSHTAPLRHFTAAVSRARRAREGFVRYWPLAPGGLPVADKARIQMLLRRHSGMDLRADRQSTFDEVLRLRMQARLVPRARDYAELLVRSQGDYCEAELLSQLLVVGETYFWRYSGQFLALQEGLVPELLRAAGSGENRFRVWSAGCSTGEEAYSVAIACRQALPSSWSLEVHATDIDRAALEQARRGEYGERALRNLPQGLRDTHFERGVGGRRVEDPIRDCVQFHHLNLASPATDRWSVDHGPFHAVFCRNVLIYFSRDEAQRVVERLERSLTVGGGLFLGAAETLINGRSGMEAIRGRDCFYFRKVAAGDPPPDAIAPVALDPPPGERAGELYALGLERADEEDFSGADEAFEELVRLFPGDARGHTGKALLLANQGREVEAGEHLEHAASCGPELAETSYLQGLIAERAGRDAEALRHYETALKRNPSLFMAHINRAWIQDRLGRKQRFLQEMRAALAILKQRPLVPQWITGGLGREALTEIVVGALRQRDQHGVRE